MHQRKMIIINPKFQLKISLYLSLMVFLLGSIYPIAIYWLTNYFITHSGASGTTATINHSSLITTLIIWHLGFTALVFLVMLFFSQRVAGPIYKLSSVMNNFLSNDILERLKLRKGDYFSELESEFNVFVDRLVDDRADDLCSLSEVGPMLKSLESSLENDLEKKKTLETVLDKIRKFEKRPSNK